MHNIRARPQDSLAKVMSNYKTPNGGHSRYIKCVYYCVTHCRCISEKKIISFVLTCSEACKATASGNCKTAEWAQNGEIERDRERGEMVGPTRPIWRKWGG